MRTYLLSFYLFIGVVLLSSNSINAQSLTVDKTLENSTIEGDSVCLEFKFVVTNEMQVALDSFRIRDFSPFVLFSNDITFTRPPSVGTFDINPAFDGVNDVRVFTIASGDDVELSVMDSMIISIKSKVPLDTIIEKSAPFTNRVNVRADDPTNVQHRVNSSIDLLIPYIYADKTLLDYSIADDSLMLVYDLIVSNQGTSDLSNIRINDAPNHVIGSPVITIIRDDSGVLEVNPDYDGDTDRFLITSASGNAATLSPGDSVQIELTYKTDLDDFNAAPKPKRNILRAIGVDAVFGSVEEFSRLILDIPVLRFTKSLESFTDLGDSVAVTFEMLMENVGSTDLDSLRIRDNFPIPTDSFEIVVIDQPTTGTLLPNPDYTGIAGLGNQLLTVMSGNEAIMACGDSVIVTLTAVVDKDSLKIVEKPIVNSGIGIVYNPDHIQIIERSSVEVFIPVVTVTKALEDISIMGDSAVFLFTYEMINCGSDTLTSLRLNDQLPFEGGSNVITIVQQPSEGLVSPNTTDPYNGNGVFPLSSENNLINTFSGSTGILYPGDSMIVSLSVKTSLADYANLTIPILNTASANASGTQSGMSTEDDSDDRTLGVPDAGSNDDPTPLPLLPAVELTKTLEDYAIEEDSVRFTFMFVVDNIGNDTLVRIRVNDRLPFTSGDYTIEVLRQPSEGIFDPNAGFTGNGLFVTSPENDLINTFEVPMDQRLYPDDSLIVVLTVATDLCNYNNLMIPSENPARATVDGVTTGLRVRNEDFALLPALPGLTLKKRIATTPPPTADTSGIFSVQIEIDVRNSGNTELSDIDVFEDLITQYGCAFAGVASPPVITDQSVAGVLPGTNDSYSGETGNENLLDGSGILQPGDSLTISVTVYLDPSCEGVASPLENFGMGQADVTDGNGSILLDDFGEPFEPITDLSDDDTDFNVDMLPDNDTGSKEDTTLLYLPQLAITKAFIEKQELVDGDLLLTFEYEVRNIGNAVMDSLTIDDPIVFYPSAIGVSPADPVITIIDVDANTLPLANLSYDGSVDTDMLDGMSGVLAPGESFLIQMEIEIDPYAYTDIMPQPQFNQAEVSGLPKEVTGAPLINPATGVIYEDGDVSDLSDDGTELDDNGDPQSSNPGSEGDGEGDNLYDDPTPINICKTYCELEARRFTNISLETSCELEITASMVGIGIEPYCDYYYSVRLLDLDDNPYPDNFIDASFLGQTIKVEITEPECNNVSWGFALIEDKIAPLFECVYDTISCTAANLEPIVPEVNDNCGLDTVYLDREVPEMFTCDEEFSGILHRKWIAVDNYGNKDTCDQKVYLERTDLGGIEWPQNRLTATNNQLICGVNDDTDPSNTGVPTLNGIPLYPFDAALICNGFVEYQDHPIEPTTCLKTIRRTWTVGEWWCSQTVEQTWVQYIEIEDTIAPVILDCPADMTVNTQSRSCTGLVDLPPISVEDGCGSPFIVRIQYPGNTLLSNGGTIELPAGTHTITYEVEDDCFRTSTCSLEVTVRDEKNPIIICERDLQVSLNGNGHAVLDAYKLDDGSFDECTDLTYEARRMTDVCGISGTDWTDRIDFCCEDAGTTIMVALRVTDEGGNTNVCMVEVDVVDKIPPRMTCLDNETVDCTENFDLENLADRFGLPTIVDNCPAANTIEERHSENINQCGIGTIYRYFDLIDAFGNVVQTCTQVITVEGETQLNELMIDWPDDLDTMNLCLEGGDLLPDNLPVGYQEPEIPEGFCNLIGFKYEDELYDASEGSQACFKIIRTWKVIDWCNKQEGVQEEFPTYEWEQIIKVENNAAPVISSNCEDVVIETYRADCGPAFVELDFAVTDDCTDNEDLIITYQIDLDDDGIMDDSGLGNAIADSFAIGVHRIFWEAEDRCGNVSGCNYTFEVRNLKGATPICLDGVSVDLIAMDTDDVPGNDTAMAILTTAHINQNSYHPCGYDITLSFSEDIEDDTLIFDCSHVGEQWVELWVTDEAGVKTFCSTTVLVTSAMDGGFCDGDPNGVVVIEGEISSLSAQKIEGVSVILKGSELGAQVTDQEGYYAFSNMNKGGDYEVVPEKDDDPLNGVSTLDIVLIQRHILGIQEITSPYLLMAADVNQDGKVSATDLIELRKVILGHYDTFKKNTSWKFIDANYQFSNIINPLDEDAPDTYPIHQLNADMTVDWIGYKVGDVSGDAQVQGRETLTSRSSGEWALQLRDQYLERGDVAEVRVLAEELEEVYGLQFDLVMDGLDVIDVYHESMDLEASQIFTDDQAVRMSIHDLNGLETKLDNGVVIIQVRARKAGMISEMINLDHTRINAEAYTGSDLKNKQMIIHWMDDHLSTGEFILGQNVPNPWSEKTEILFELPQSGDVIFMIRDVTGKLIKRSVMSLEAGKHRYEVKGSEFHEAGVLIYELIYDGEQISKRMIRLK